MLTRRELLASLAALSGCGTQPQARAESFFTVGQRNGRWFLFDPAGTPTFSIGLNHIDSTTLRLPAGGDVWRERFGNSERRFIEEGVRPDLIDWGFNCVGWNQEVVIRGESLSEGGILHRHSRSWTPEEYRWLDLPYCHMLPFIASHQWDRETKLPDIRSAEFEEWCDYVARADCARLADDPNLVGYFYTDCPIWVHSRVEHKPAIFDPELLKTEAGRKELFDLATHYYRVIHDAVCRYDKNHLLLGDRYEARRPLSEEVIRASVPYVDVLCFQDFGPIDEVTANFRKWHDLTGLPVILADASARQADAPKLQTYSQKMEALRELDFCVGWHLCGAYLRNTARKRGIRTEAFEPDEAFIAELKRVNHETHEYIAAQANPADGSDA